MALTDLELRLSGGAGNADPTQSIGGTISNTKVLSQSATLATAIGGVTASYAAGNSEGTGVLSYFHTTKELSWKPPGATVAGTAVNVSVSGTYLVRGASVSDGYIVVDVVAGNLGLYASLASNVTIATNDALLLPHVSKDEALVGATQYYLYYIMNNGLGTMRQPSVKLESDSTGPDTLSIALTTLKNDSEQPVEASAHTYVPFSTALSMTDLTPGDYWGVWIKREVPVSTQIVPANRFKLSVTTFI